MLFWAVWRRRTALPRIATLVDFAFAATASTRAPKSPTSSKRSSPPFDGNDRFAAAERVLRERFAPELHADDPDTYCARPARRGPQAHQ